MASNRFHRLACGTPIIRAIARRRATELFDLVAGFSYSQIVLAAVETGLLDLLRAGPATVGDVATHAGLSDNAALRLLRGAAALGLTERIDAEHWMLGTRGAILQANDGVRAMIKHHRLLYEDLRDPVGLLRADRASPTALSAFWGYGAAETAADYSALMALTQEMVSEQIRGAYSFSRHRAVLDVGGGHGAFIRALASRYPQIPSLGVFDLPPVVESLRSKLDQNGLSGRIATHSGDFLIDALPTGYDCVTLVRILHDHDDEPALRLLRSVRAALPPAGRLIIAEPLAETAGSRTMGDAYFGFYLWAMGSGRPRSRQEVGEMIREAGFRHYRVKPTSQPVITSLVVAQA